MHRIKRCQSTKCPAANALQIPASFPSLGCFTVSPGKVTQSSSKQKQEGKNKRCKIIPGLGNGCYSPPPKTISKYCPQIWTSFSLSRAFKIFQINLISTTSKVWPFTVFPQIPGQILYNMGPKPHKCFGFKEHRLQAEHAVIAPCNPWYSILKDVWKFSRYLQKPLA